MFVYLHRQETHPSMPASKAGTRLRRVGAALAAVAAGLGRRHPGRLRQGHPGPAPGRAIPAHLPRAGPGQHRPRGQRHRRHGQLADRPDRPRRRPDRGRRNHRAGPGTGRPPGRPHARRLTRPRGSCTAPALSPATRTARAWPTRRRPGPRARTSAIPVPGTTTRQTTSAVSPTSRYRAQRPERQPAGLQGSEVGFELVQFPATSSRPGGSPAR